MKINNTETLRLFCKKEAKSCRWLNSNYVEGGLIIVSRPLVGGDITKIYVNFKTTIQAIKMEVVVYEVLSICEIGKSRSNQP